MRSCFDSGSASNSGLPTRTHRYSSSADIGRTHLPSCWRCQPPCRHRPAEAKARIGRVSPTLLKGATRGDARRDFLDSSRPPLPVGIANSCQERCATCGRRTSMTSESDKEIGSVAWDRGGAACRDSPKRTGRVMDHFPSSRNTWRPPGSGVCLAYDVATCSDRLVRRVVLPTSECWIALASDTGLLEKAGLVVVAGVLLWSASLVQRMGARPNDSPS